MNRLMINTLENSLNLALLQDPQKLHILSLTKYKTLMVKVTDWNLQFIFVPTESNIKVIENFTDEEENPDCILTGKLFDLVSLGISDNAQKIIQDKRVEQQGDLHMLEDYQAAIKAFRFDLPEQIKNALGPNLTHLITSPIKVLSNWLSNSFSSTKKDVTEYAQEESQMLPPSEEVKDFFDDIQELSLKLDRLTAQMNEYKHSTSLKDGI